MYEKVILVGNLGRDPELRYTPSGQTVTNFSIATTESWTKDGEKHERTKWWTINAWGKLAEITNQYLHKGDKVLVEGRMVSDDKGNPRTFTRTDGSAGAKFEMTAATVKFLSTKRQDAPAEAEAEVGATPEADAIPF